MDSRLNGPRDRFSENGNLHQFFSFLFGHNNLGFIPQLQRPLAPEQEPVSKKNAFSKKMRMSKIFLSKGEQKSKLVSAHPQITL